MVDPGVLLTNINGGPYPNYTGKNATGAGATDGTEWIAGLINDYILGWTQFLMDAAGLSPDGVAESASASQIVDAMRLVNGTVPGTIMEWNLNADPASFGVRALLMNGQGILRANYPDLDTNVYVGDGNNAAVAAAGGAYYHADDAAGTTPNTAGVYLILPERRGTVPRGLDLAASIDPDGASRYLGDLQIDAFQDHEHFIFGRHRNTSTAASPEHKGLNAGGTYDSTQGTDGPKTGVAGTPRTDSETRMYNTSTQFAIRY